MTDKQATEGTYHLSLKGPGMSIDKDVDPRIAGAIAQMTFGGLPEEISRVAGSKAVLTPVPGQRVSLREYLQRAAPSGGIHMKILAVGRYMRDFEKQDDFGREDIRSRFRAAGEPQPANFPRDFQKAVREGWIAEDPQNHGRYYVTRTGDNAIDQQAEASVTPPPSTRRRRRVRVSEPSGAQ